MGMKLSMSSKDLLAEVRKHIALMSIAEADALRQQGVTLIDVREVNEFEECAIEGAINIPRGLLEFTVDNHPYLSDRTQAYILYCRSGGRASLAAATLKQMGFTQVYALNAGFQDWLEQGKPVQSQYVFPLSA